MTERDQVNKLFRQFKNKNVLVELRDNNQAEGKIIAIDNYLNIVFILFVNCSFSSLNIQWL